MTLYMSYLDKYLKYKQKYLELKKQIGGLSVINNTNKNYININNDNDNWIYKNNIPITINNTIVSLLEQVIINMFDNNYSLPNISSIDTTFNKIKNIFIIDYLNFYFTYSDNERKRGDVDNYINSLAINNIVILCININSTQYLKHFKNTNIIYISLTQSYKFDNTILDINYNAGDDLLYWIFTIAFSNIIYNPTEKIKLISNDKQKLYDITDTKIKNLQSEIQFTNQNDMYKNCIQKYLNKLFIFYVKIHIKQILQKYFGKITNENVIVATITNKAKGNKEIIDYIKNRIVLQPIINKYINKIILSQKIIQDIDNIKQYILNLMDTDLETDKQYFNKKYKQSFIDIILLNILLLSDDNWNDIFSQNDILNIFDVNVKIDIANNTVLDNLTISSTQFLNFINTTNDKLNLIFKNSDKNTCNIKINNNKNYFISNLVEGFLIKFSNDHIKNINSYRNDELGVNLALKCNTTHNCNTFEQFITYVKNLQNIFYGPCDKKCDLQRRCNCSASKQQIKNLVQVI